MRRLGVLGLTMVLLLAGLSGPAHAAFTPTEIASLQRPFWAATGNLHDGVNAELILVLKDGTTEATRPKIAEVYRLIILAQKQIGLGISDLVGGSYYPAKLGNPNPRSFYVSRAVSAFTAADGTLEQAKGAIAACIAAGCNSYYMGRLRDIRVAGALTHLRAFNRTLAYADPYPPGRSPQGRLLVVGPHGMYDEAQQRLRGATDFLIRAYDATINAYKSDAVLSAYWSVSQQLKFASLVYVQNIQGMATIAGIYLNTTEQAQSPFFRLLDRMQTMSFGGGGTPCFAGGEQLPGDPCHGLPYNYNNFTARLIDSTSEWATRPTFQAWQIEALRRMNESWDASQTGVWFLMIFPECDQLNAPAGCGGTGAPPDTTAPSVSVAAPLPGAVVAGTIMVQATASDAVGVTDVRLFVDGALVGAPLATAPYTFLLDTWALANGAHTLHVDARDAAGNTGSAAVSVTVSNVSLDFVGATAGALGAVDVALPAHQKGDLLLIVARGGSTVQPALPVGWTSLQAASAGRDPYGVSARLGYKIAGSAGETSGTWAGANILLAQVYRGARVGSSAVATGITSPGTMPGLTLTARDGSSWVVGAVVGRGDPMLHGPAGLTRRQVGAPTVVRSYGYDTAGGVSAWAGATFTHATAAHISVAVELVSESVRSGP